MARYIYQGTFKDQNGAVVGSLTTSDGNPGTVTVYLAGTTTLASVYIGASGGTAVNSVSTDTYGYFYFWVDDGDYTIDQWFKIVLTHPDFLTRTYDNISIINVSTTYLQTIIDASADSIDFLQAGTGAVTRTLQNKMREPISVKDFSSSFATAITAIGSTEATLIVNDDCAVATSVTTPSTLELECKKGSVITIASGQTLTIQGPINAGKYQIFAGTGTVVFGTANADLNHDTVTEIYPEWWGTFPNGTDDTDVLNKAIAASEITHTDYAGRGMAVINIGAGNYYIRPGELSAISCSINGPEACFFPTVETNVDDTLFNFQFLASTNRKHIRLGGIWGLTAWNAGTTTHYHTGIAVTSGDSATFDIGQLVGLKLAVTVSGASLNAHTGIHEFNIKSIVGCDTGVWLAPGLISGTDVSANCCEGNNFNIEYMTYVGYGVVCYSAASGDALCYQNKIVIDTLELHATPLDTVVGFLVDGAQVKNNKFIVTRNLMPSAAVGSFILTIDNSASENLFKLAHFDLSKCNLAEDAGYNVFHQECESITVYPGLLTNAYARSTISGTTYPSAGVWRQGDKCWNTEPAAAGYVGWVCITSGGTGGTWKGFGVIQS